MVVEDRDLGKLEQNVATLTKSVEKLAAMIYDPENGLFAQTIKLQGAVDKLQDEVCDLTKHNKETCSTVKEAVSNVAASIAQHIADQKVHSAKGLLLRRDVATVVILAFLVMHSLVPQDFSVFDAVRKVFGF